MINLFLASLEDLITPNNGKLAGIVAFIAVLLVLRRQVIQIYDILLKPVKWIIKAFKAPGEILIRLGKQDVFLEQIRGQLFSNSGSSLADKLDECILLAKKADSRSTILTENSTIPSFEANSKAEITFSNTALAELFGLEKEEMKGTNYLKGVHNEQRASFYKTFKDSIEQKIPFSYNFLCVNQHNGLKTDCYIKCDVIKDLKGQIIFLSGIVEIVDKTKKKI